MHEEIKDNTARIKRIKSSRQTDLVDVGTFSFKPCQTDDDYYDLKEKLKEAAFRKKIVGEILISCFFNLQFVFVDFSSLLYWRCNGGGDGTPGSGFFVNDFYAKEI